jgi:hypothetical protein
MSEKILVDRANIEALHRYLASAIVSNHSALDWRREMTKWLSQQSEPEKTVTSELSGADRYATLQDMRDAMDKALNTITDRIRAIERRQELQVDAIGKRLEMQPLGRANTECYLEDGTLLWEVPYGFRSMFKAGQDLIENHKRYIVISAEMVGKTQQIIVREEPE